MYTTLALEKAMKAHGLKADFRATGQTGILIAGSGVSIDAVVADFISGAVEYLAPANEADHWDLIEGQGSLFHASSAGRSEERRVGKGCGSRCSARCAPLN